jgi:hypothetical protein
MSVRGAWQLPRLRCERCFISRSSCGRSASRLAFGGGLRRDAARARLGAVAKGIDPKAERLEQPFVAPRHGVDRAGIDLLGRRPVMHDRRSSRLPFVPACAEYSLSELLASARTRPVCARLDYGSSHAPFEIVCQGMNPRSFRPGLAAVLQIFLS